ncbi:gustatory receptor for sugar taste 43a-like [Macrosteles quadrilineatus]|uniref:gustatory receptor for sugar taste 43a-like n=1 Tax=Macrosteles quadrilineatus TaxID=74068 RepID=UPI0023E1F254|nr:gustatory receptor for sugar taste 43a-like [Macrosteles quadrilineatus]
MTQSVTSLVSLASVICTGLSVASYTRPTVSTVGHSYLTCSTCSFTDTSDDTVRYLIGLPRLSDLHWTLCGIIHKTNSIFSWPLLAHMFSLFLHIIIAPYFLFFSVNLYSKEHVSEKSITFLLHQCAWVIAHSLNLIFLMIPCTNASQEAQKTAPMICRHLNREMRPETQKQLETFVLQLLHYKAEFTVFGLFPLHCPILTSIAGAVTTYLVILIQFQNADDSQ